MGKFLLNTFVALVLLSGLIMTVLGQGSKSPSCAPSCWGQPCRDVLNNDCKGKGCKCTQFISPRIESLCITCRTENCPCTTLPIADKPKPTCCAGLKCSNVNSKGDGICKK